MKRGVKYSELRKDILDLYCKVKTSSVENIFIKVAQASDRAFFRWLQGHRDIKKELMNPEVVDAFETLVFLKNKTGDNPTVSNIIRSVSSHSKHLSMIPVIIAMGNVMDDSLDILAPFAGIINIISNQMRMPEGQDAEDTSIIREDLELLQNKFNSIQEEKADIRPPISQKKGTLTDRRKNMFFYLLQRFSNDMAAASSSSGFKELASAFRDGVLASPPYLGLGKYIELDPPNESQIQTVLKIVNYVYSYPDAENAPHHYNLINVEFLREAGSITQEDSLKFKEIIDSKRDVMGYMRGEEIEDVEVDIPSDMRMNPDYIFMLATFFYTFQKKIKILPSAFSV